MNINKSNGYEMDESFLLSKNKELVIDIEDVDMKLCVSENGRYMEYWHNKSPFAYYYCYNDHDVSYYFECSSEFCFAVTDEYIKI